MDDKLLDSLIEYLEKLHHIDASSIPEVDLYMDQVTSFIDKNLEPIKRHHEDKALTKTMINNYAKNKLLPPPDRKKYSKEHTLILLFIYYYKGILSLTDIETILQPINNRYFASEGKPSYTDIYEEIFSLEDSQMEALMDDVKKKFEYADGAFDEASYPSDELSDEERSDLRRFTFLALLGFDVYLKRQLMEHIVDDMRKENEEKLAKQTAARELAKRNKRK